ncbi:MAG: FkbM family methyltransferase [Gemmatimonadota bacterium]|nr:FkbM family methyltransferase [Gemmatimonadota bacterium]
MREAGAGMGQSEARVVDAFGEPGAWGECRPGGRGALWLRVARSFPGSRPWSRFALLARRAARRHLAGPVDTRVWGQRLRLYPDRSVSEARILFLPRSWDRAERRLLAKWARPGFTFVDVGANVGGYSFWVLSLVRTSVRVVAVEPNPDLARQLRFNVGINGAQDRVRVLEAAVGAVRDTGALVVHPRNSGEGRLAEVGERPEYATARDSTGAGRVAPPTIPVRIVTLADIVRDAGLDRLDCLKVDVEGHEPDVIQPFLRDAPHGLWPRHLIVELKTGRRDGQRSAELESWLIARGYRLELRTRLNGLFRLA